LITGGEGDISKAITKELNDYKVFAPSKHMLDVTNLDALYLESMNPTYIINNAGFIEPSLISKTDFRTFKRHFEINLFAPFNISKWAMNHGCKGVIHIGSSSIDGKIGWSAYCSSKMALNILSETLSREGFPSVVISPGRTDTKMRRRLYPGEDKTTLLEPEHIAKIARLVLADIKKYGGKEILIKKIDGQVVTAIRKRVYDLEAFK